MMSVRKVRKPRDFEIERTTCGQGLLHGFTVCADNTVIGSADPAGTFFDAKDCRKLATWLNKAAEYLDYKTLEMPNIEKHFKKKYRK